MFIFKITSWSSLVAQQVKDPVLSLGGWGPRSVVGSISGLGTSTCHGCGQKKNKNKNKNKKHKKQDKK